MRVGASSLTTEVGRAAGAQHRTAGRRHRTGLLVLMTIVSLAAAFAGPLARVASAVTATDLGTLGGESSEATAVNDSGQVVGRAETSSGDVHAFSWTHAGGMVDLGTLVGGKESEATAVNASGQVVGWSYTSSGNIHAFSWTHAGGMVDLGTLGSGSSEATAVNASGQVVGWSYTSSGNVHAFSWTHAGGMVDLGTLGGTESEAVAVNDSGQVVGGSTTGSPYIHHAFSWTQSGGMVDLGTLGGNESNATAVNDSGQAIGWAETSSANQYAFSWTQAGGIVDLGTLGGGCSFADAVNDCRQVVGWACSHASRGRRRAGWSTWARWGGIQRSRGRQQFRPGRRRVQSDFFDHAFAWTQAGGMVDLGTLGGESSEAVAVNDSGQVVGEAETGSGDPHAVLWEVGAGRPPKTKKTTYKYCTKAQPKEIGTVRGQVQACVKVTDAYNGVSAYSISIQPPANSKTSGGCPSYVIHLYSRLICEVTGYGSNESGSGVTDHCEYEARMDHGTPYGGNEHHRDKGGIRWRSW